MSLPAGQQRMLDGIEDWMRAHDSRLASLFATFTRLTRHEEMPGFEQLTLPRSSRVRSRQRPGPAPGLRAVGLGGRVRWLALVPVALVAVASAFVIGLAVVSDPGQCGSGVAAHGTGRCRYVAWHRVGSYCVGWYRVGWYRVGDGSAGTGSAGTGVGWYRVGWHRVAGPLHWMRGPAPTRWAWLGPPQAAGPGSHRGSGSALNLPESDVQLRADGYPSRGHSRPTSGRRQEPVGTCLDRPKDDTRPVNWAFAIPKRTGPPGVRWVAPR